MKVETALLMIGIIGAIAVGVIIAVSNTATPVFAQKFLICHHDREIEVPFNAIDNHLSHGDFLGPCAI
jgi:hypothetical protein